MKGAWIPIALFAVLTGGEVWAWRADWTADTRDHPKLQTLRVRSGQQLSLERSEDKPDQPIVDYQTPARHSHRVRIYMKRARLSDESRGAFTQLGLPAPKGDGVLEVAPDPKYERVKGSECQVSLLVGFAPAGRSPDRTVSLYPAQPGETDGSERIIHLQSSSELSVRLSSNSTDGKHGPRCRSMLTISQDQQTWSNPLGMDWEWKFIAAPNFDIRIAFAPDLWTGEGEMDFGQELESLALEPIQPLRLTILPVGASRPITSRERKGEPIMTANASKLGPDFLDLGLEGRLSIPIRESLAGWQWAVALAGLNIPLLVWSVRGLRKRERVFFSYSREDLDRVMEICESVKRAGGKPWIDLEDIRFGEDWEKRIEMQMRRSRHVLVFLSEHAVRVGGFFWIEMGSAVRLAKQRAGEAFLIPVMLEPCTIPDPLIPFNALRLFEAGGLEKLLAALQLTGNGNGPVERFRQRYRDHQTSLRTLRTRRIITRAPR